MNIAPQTKHPMPLAMSLIAAGPAVEIGEDYQLLDINALITGGREGFGAYELTGDSADPDIRHGNIIFVEFTAEPRNGQFVAATVNGLTCVKEFQHTQRGLYLISKNKSYPPRHINATDSFEILGVVRGHLAVYNR